MPRATVELDFFGMEKDNSCKSQFQKFVDRRRSFQGLRGAISKMNPDIIKSVIACGLTNQSQGNVNQIDSIKSFSVPSSPKAQSPFPTLPLLNPAPRATSENGRETAPLTTFYNGTVSIFNVPRDKAESILKVAVEGSCKNVDSSGSKVASPSSDQQQLLENLNGDLPICSEKVFAEISGKVQREVDFRIPLCLLVATPKKKNAFCDRREDPIVLSLRRGD